MHLFEALPALRSQTLLRGRAIPLVGVSAIVYDHAACYFEIAKPRHWCAHADDTTRAGIGAIGGRIEPGETVVECLYREVYEELGARVGLEPPRCTFLIQAPADAPEGGWVVTGAWEPAPSEGHPAPWMIIVLPSGVGGVAGLSAICAFRARLRPPNCPEVRDLFGLLRVEHGALGEFFARDEWPVDDLQAQPGVTVVVNGAWPRNPVLRPVLTARAFQLLVRAGAHQGQTGGVSV